MQEDAYFWTLVWNLRLKWGGIVLITKDLELVPVLWQVKVRSSWSQCWVLQSRISRMEAFASEEDRVILYSWYQTRRRSILWGILNGSSVMGKLEWGCLCTWSVLISKWNWLCHGRNPAEWMCISGLPKELCFFWSHLCTWEFLYLQLVVKMTSLSQTHVPAAQLCVRFALWIWMMLLMYLNLL